nr:sigma 54-interacting transcriptional regulator [Bacteriovorax sp. HI3]
MLKMLMLKILVIDDDKLSRMKIKSHLADHHVVEASSYEEAVERLTQNFDLCFIDLNLDNTEVLLGFEILKITVQKGIYSVVMSSLHDEEIIEHAYELGCNDYYTKGTEKNSIADTLNRFLLSKNDYLENHFFKEIFPTKSKEQKNILKKIIPVIQTELPICLLGESGTGKTFLAKEIHEQSKRPGPFVAVNCAALSEELLESELFGHAKGAFTGATSDSKGKLALANHGTLFLDEIGSMSKGLQAKLLKAIEEKSFYQVNSDKLIKSDFRIISATLDNLEEKIKSGEFRFDLFQRLCGLNVELLPLRERKEDILDLIKKELVQVSESGRKIVLSKEAKSILENHSWPGNIRELKRVFQLIAIDNKGLISKDDIEKHLEERAFSLKGNLLVKNQMQMALTMGLPEFLEEIEKEVVNHALANNNHAIRKTLAQLKINQARLYKHIKSGKGELSEVH